MHNTETNNRFSRKGYLEAAKQFGSPEDVAEQALSNLIEGEVVGLAVSGKLASGKDTVAPTVLSRLCFPSIEHLFFAHPLKEEFNQILDIMRDAPSASAATRVLVDQLTLADAHARKMVEKMYVFANEYTTLTAFDRTPEIRSGLQYLGTDVRRSQDENWWVNRSMYKGIEALANGRSVFYTDCRFPNEVEASGRIGCLTVRLDITPETQASRLMGRDGLVVDEKAISHPSETVLDNYPNFDLRVSNDTEIETPIAAALAAVRAHQQRYADIG